MSLSITSSWEESSTMLGDGLAEVRSGAVNVGSDGRMCSNEYTEWGGREECVLMSSAIWGGFWRRSNWVGIRVGSMAT